jgi:hypothetical protein
MGHLFRFGWCAAETQSATGAPGPVCSKLPTCRESMGRRAVALEPWSAALQAHRPRFGSTARRRGRPAASQLCDPRGRTSGERRPLPPCAANGL